MKYKDTIEVPEKNIGPKILGSNNVAPNFVQHYSFAP